MQQVSLSMQQQQQVKWRRAKVLELMSKGETNQSEIARILQIDRSIVCRDVACLRHQTKENITKYVGERLRRVREMSCWIEQRIKGSMDHVPDRRQCKE
jgi:transcriptional regulator